MSEAAMQKATFQNNWNIPTLVGLAGLLMAVGGTYAKVVTAFNSLDGRILAVEQFRQSRVAATDSNFAAINAQLASMANIPYRVGQAEARIDDAGKRIDRLSEAIINSLDAIRKDVSSLAGRVEVLSAKIDTLTEQSRDKRAELTGPPREFR